MFGRSAPGSWYRLCAAALAVAAWWLAEAPSAHAEPPAPAATVSNQLCLMCHAQPGLTAGASGRERAIAAVDVTAFAASAHGGERCVTCHADQSALPHPSIGPGTTVRTASDCATCHREAVDGYFESPHGTMAELRDASGPACADCHGSAHVVRPVAGWTQEQRAQVCAGCHPGAGTTFLQALSHQAPSPHVLPSAYFAGRFLVVLASASLAFGIIHTELDLLRWMARRWRGGSGRRAPWESR
jgi:hypothetical protein